jgi:hypothetical protein
MDDEWTTSYHLAGFVGILPAVPLLLLTATRRGPGPGRRSSARAAAMGSP